MSLEKHRYSDHSSFYSAKASALRRAAYGGRGPKVCSIYIIGGRGGYRKRTVRGVQMEVGEGSSQNSREERASENKQ